MCDVSFISLELALPAGARLAGPDACLIALIKPQFEVGKGQVGRAGWSEIRPCTKRSAHGSAVGSPHSQGWHVQGVVESPITGPKGNREFLIAATRPTSSVQARPG